MIYAAIDLGTNTFHLLIVKDENGKLIEIYRKRFFVKLAEGGISNISKEAWLRAKKALQHFREKIDLYKIDTKHTSVMGTAALRNASNQEAFTAMVQEEYQFQIQIISGDREAELISAGVLGALIPFDLNQHCIIDIGGGSVEFIIWVENAIVWKKSFPIGVAILTQKFHKNDPISQEEIKELENYLKAILNDLFHQLKAYKIKHLVGASGSFEVLYLMGACKNGVAKTAYEIDLVRFQNITKNFIQSSLEDRLAMEHLPNSRADMVVVAFLLIDFLQKNHVFDELYFSRYAMKEGMLYELMN